MITYKKPQTNSNISPPEKYIITNSVTKINVTNKALVLSYRGTPGLTAAVAAWALSFGFNVGCFANACSNCAAGSCVQEGGGISYHSQSMTIRVALGKW